MLECALTNVVADRIWSLERPVWFSGARLRARTTVVRLDDGGLLLHTPAPPTDALVAELRALGPVRWLLVPNCWHHLGAPAAAARFPEAKVVGPASALERNRALRIDVDIHDARFREQVPELEPLAPTSSARPARTITGAGASARGSRAATVGCASHRMPERRSSTRARPPVRSMRC
jgi:hypothetical protein